MGVRSKLKRQALGLSQKAVERLMADGDRAAKVAQLMGSVQRGRQALEKGQQDLLRAFQFAPRDDYQALGKRLAQLKRRLRTLDDRLGKIDAATRTS